MSQMMLRHGAKVTQQAAMLCSRASAQAARLHCRGLVAQSQPENAAAGVVSAKPDIHKLAKMAQIAITDQEAKEMEPKINSILNWFDQLQNVDTTGVLPAIHASNEGTVLRADEQIEYSARAELLQLAPSLERGYVRVPKIATGADGAAASGAKPTAAAAPAPAPASAASPAAAAPSTSGSGGGSGAEGADRDALAVLDFRVGRIVSCERHPEADSLYVEKIDIGEADVRTIVSGLVKYVSLEEMQNRMVVIVANLKPRNMRGIKSAGMVLAASDEPKTQVLPIAPPEGAAVGERLWFGNNREQPAPAVPNAVEKKKLWEAAAPGLRTDASGVATWKGEAMMTSAGPVTAPSLPNARVA